MVETARKIIILADSRGQFLLESLNKELEKEGINTQLTVEHKGGATIESMTEIAETLLSKQRFNQVYFFVGVNNLTEKHSNGRVTGRFDDHANLIEIMEQKMDNARRSLGKYTNKFIACHILGIDIATYNKATNPNDYHQMQTIINTALPTLNAAIDAQNMASNTIGPWLSDTIHSNINGRLVHKYKRLPDGIHPDEITRALWAKKFVKAIENNMS